MWEVIGAIMVPILKAIFSKIADKELSDKEFVEYVLAHQKKRARAGQSALDWEAALKKAKAEMKNYEE